MGKQSRRLAMGASGPNLNSRTAWLDGMSDSGVICIGYAFNVIKRTEFGRDK
jgi:hypothetical protein